MNRCPRFVLFIALIIASLCSMNAFAQTGEIMVDPEQVLRIKEWQPEPRGEMESIVVDLRHRMPAVQNQSMGDCSAWAYGYAAKSYLEVVDQNWKPDQPQRIFSPKFIYNSLNNGEDKGLNPVATLKFLEEVGCATLRTAPYIAGDFKTKPTQAAIEEAKLFRIAGHYLLKTGADVRAAVQQGHVCPVSVRTNPIFNSGRYEVYTKELHEKGLALRKAGDKHGMHAMAIVGYDDRKGAFLLMNSWGTDWGQKGFCWVDYEVFKKFNYVEKIETELVNFAVVLQDRREPVEVDAGGAYRSAGPSKESLIVQAGGEYRGFDSASKKHQYFFASWITGSTQSLALVEQVRWSAKIDGKVVTADSNTAANYFRFSNTLSSNVIPIEGVIVFKDKTTRTVNTELRLPPPSGDHRQVELTFSDWYEGKWNLQGRPTSMWQWQVEVTGNLTDLADIERVTFNVGNLNGREPTITHEADKFRASNGSVNIRQTGLASATNEITALVLFKDGSKKNLSLFPTFKSPADDTYTLESSYREDGNDGVDTWYSWTVSFKSPRDIRTKIDAITYELGPTQDDRKVRVQDFYGGFIVTGSAKREFRVFATVAYNDGRAPLKLEHWVTLGKGGKYADPRRIEIDVTDQYHGIDEYKRPIWKVVMKPMGDSTTLKQIEKVVYEFPEGFKPREVVTQTATHPTHGVDLMAARSMSMMATVHFKDGNFTRFPFEVKPRSPRDDRFAFVVRSHKVSPTATPTWSTAFYGPEIERRRVSKVDYRYTLNNERFRTLFDFGYHNQGSIYNVANWITDDSTVDAVITFNDSSQQYESHAVSKATDGRAVAVEPWSVVLREKFWGYTDGKPRWRVQMKIMGTPEAIATIEGVRYEWPLDNGDPQHLEFKALNDPKDFAKGYSYDHETYISSHTPFQVKVKTNGQWTTHHRAALAMSPRTAEPVVLKQARYTFGDKPEQQRSYDWIVYVDGWESKLWRIKRVEYQLPQALGGQKVVVVDRFAEGHSGFAMSGRSTAPATIDAVVTFDDDTTQKVYVQTGLPNEPLGFTAEDQYWGLNWEKKPTWRVTYRQTGDYWEHLTAMERIDFHLREFSNSYDKKRVLDSPMQVERVLTTGDLVMEHYYATYTGQRWKKFEPKETIKLKSPQIQLIGLRQTAGLTPEKLAGAAKEWVVHVVGPESNMATVKNVTYEIELPSRKHTITTANRWGETQGGWEMRYFAEQQANVKAIVEFNSGAKMELVIEGK